MSTIGSVCLSRCLSVCHAPSNCFFFFASRWNQALFWPSVLHVPLYKIVFFRFLILACKAQNLLPKICTKSLISWLVWQIDRRCVGFPGGFGGWPIQWNHAKCCGSDPCCHGNEIWTRRRDPVAYRLVLCYVLCSCFKQHEYGMSEHSSHLNAVIRPTVKCTVKSDIKL